MYTLEEERQWLSIYETNGFNIIESCKRTDIPITHIYKLIAGDKRDKYIFEHKDHTFEEAILFTMRSGLSKYIESSEYEQMFYPKAKHCGYDKNQEVEANRNEDIYDEFSSQLRIIETWRGI